MKPRPGTTRRRCAARLARRGVTFLEVVFATVLLSLVISAMMSVYGYCARAQARERQSLGAVELANRLILMYLDDRATLPSRIRPIEYGVDSYRWDIDVRNMLMDRAVAVEASPTASPLGDDQVRVVTVTVWLAERTGGTVLPAEGAATVRVSRLVDPYNFLRNPDSFERTAKNNITSLIDALQGQDAGTIPEDWDGPPEASP